jgi:hypothetical protein
LPEIGHGERWTLSSKIVEKISKKRGKSIKEWV